MSATLSKCGVSKVYRLGSYQVKNNCMREFERKCMKTNISKTKCFKKDVTQKVDSKRPSNITMTCGASSNKYTLKARKGSSLFNKSLFPNLSILSSKNTYPGKTFSCFSTMPWKENKCPNEKQDEKLDIVTQSENERNCYPVVSGNTTLDYFRDKDANDTSPEFVQKLQNLVKKYGGFLHFGETQVCSFQSLNMWIGDPEKRLLLESVLNITDKENILQCNNIELNESILMSPDDRCKAKKTEKKPCKKKETVKEEPNPKPCLKKKQPCPSEKK